MNDIENLIEYVKDHSNNFLGSKATLKEKETFEHMYDLLIETLEKQLTNEWIPVTERIPEKSGYYLIQQDCAGITGYMRVARYNANDCKFRSSEARCCQKNSIKQKALMILRKLWSTTMNTTG